MKMSATTMRKFVVGAVLLMVGALLAGCTVAATVGSGRVTTETRAVSGFDAVEFSFMGEVAITQGEEEGLTITGDDNILPLIKTEVQNGVLRIYTQGVNVAQPITPLRYDLKVKDLRRVVLSGAGNIAAPALTTDRLEATVSGAGGIEINDLTADTLRVNLSGLGNANFAGEVANQEVTLSGAGSYFGEDLRSGVAKITISGMGDAAVWATEMLNATISGAGNISYKGSPNVRQQVSGVGKIEALGE
jgi:hypothetical protein